MKVLLVKTIRTASRLSAAAASNRGGAAGVEFALVLPLMLLMYLGSAEITQALMASRSATLTARTLADLVSQQPNGVNVTDATAAQVFTAASAIMAPFPSNSLAMTITSINFVADSNAPTGYDAEPAWTVVQNGGTPRPCAILTAVSDTVTPSPTTLPQGVYAQGSIIVADVVYTYQPGFGGNFFSASGLANVLTYVHSAYMRPRQWTGSPDYIGYTGSSATICPSY